MGNQEPRFEGIEYPDIDHYPKLTEWLWKIPDMPQRTEMPVIRIETRTTGTVETRIEVEEEW